MDYLNVMVIKLTNFSRLEVLIDWLIVYTYQYQTREGLSQQV